MSRNKSNTRHDDRDYDKGHGKDKNWGKKDNIWDCDSGFWGRPHFQKVVVEKPHKFSGNKFKATLDEGVGIDSKEEKMLGIHNNNLKVNENTVVSGKITYEEAWFFNTLGVFSIAKNGTINGASIVVKDTGNVGATFELETGANAKEIGFFLIQNGDHDNDFASMDFTTGDLKFYYNHGQADERLAKVTDDGNKVTLVYTAQNGEETVVDGPIWFTNERGGSNSLNSDGMEHAISGVVPGDCETLKIAFEDVERGLSDRDYNDTIFTVQLMDEIEVCKPIKCCDIIDRGCEVDKAICDFVYKNDKGDCAPPPPSSCNGQQVTAAAILCTPPQDDNNCAQPV